MIPSSFYKLSGVLIAVDLLWNTNTCSSFLLPESFEACGIFLADFQPISNKQTDVTHEIIEHLQLNQNSLRSVIIENDLTKKDIHPDIFRSMKYDCFLHVHINFGNILSLVNFKKGIFSSIPPFETPLQSALYQKALFLIVTNSSPYKMKTEESWCLHFERQYRVFIIRINTTLHYNQHRTKPFVFYQRYFFCSLCKRGLIRVNAKYTNFLSLKLSSFQNKWIYAEHYYMVSENSLVKNDEFCRRKNVMYLYRVKANCAAYVMLIQMIVFASGLNFTTKLYKGKYFDYSKIPQISENQQYSGLEEHLQFSSPVLKHYKFPSIIYCFNLGRQTIAESNMWTKYVALDIWALVGLCLVLFAILNANNYSRKIKLKLILQDAVQFADSFLKIIGLILRQSWSYSWKLLGVLELLLSILLSVYENCITASVVVPVVPQPFLHTRELYNNNYTFVTEVLSFDRVNEYLYTEYDTPYYRKNEPAKVLKGVPI